MTTDFTPALALLNPTRISTLMRCIVQALFRKIAAALPGMESLSATKQEDLVDVNLSDKASSKPAAAAQQCQC